MTNTGSMWTPSSCLLVYIRPPPCGEALEGTLREWEPWLKGDEIGKSRVPAASDSNIVQDIMGKQSWGAIPKCHPARWVAQGHSVNRANVNRFSL